MRQQMATKEMIDIPDDDEESCAAVSTPSCSRGAATSSTDTAPSTEHTATGAPLYSVSTALPQHQSRYSQGSHCPCVAPGG